MKLIRATGGVKRDTLACEQCVHGEILIVQSIQLSLSGSLGSTTSNEANKSKMWHTKCSITESQAVIHLAQMKYQFLSQNTASRILFFQEQTIKTDHT